MNTFSVGCWLFIRGLGLAFFFAFGSLALQIEGLIGESGILPASEFLDTVQKSWGSESFFKVPTIFWLWDHDYFLTGVALVGLVGSVVLIVGLLPRLMIALLWVLYLSISTVGQNFLAFQWDLLLLECAVVAMIVAPSGVRPRFRTTPQPHPLGSLLLKVVLFKLMFSSGVVKLSSGDEVWRSLEALMVHYETQPLPTWVGWYAHQFPAWFQKTSVVAVFAIQLLVPFGLFLPRVFRHGAVALLLFLQLLIALTGNYCFFNFLTAVLCLSLVDDQMWRRFRQIEPGQKTSSPKWRKVGLITMVSVLLFLNTLVMTRTLFGYVLPDFAASILAAVRPLRSVNNYGLFAVMTTARPEIQVEGSMDGKSWRPYRFRYKVGPLERAPGFVAPHQPRLDWQMWFAALGNYRRNPWLGRFMVRLLEGSPAVIGLLDGDPFKKEGRPRFVRALRFQYRFTRWSEKDTTGRWWTRTPDGVYLPTFSLKDYRGAAL